MSNIPLAERLRPNNLDEYYGQEHLIGENCILRNMIETNSLSSFIMWGPPGVGKTTLAKIISKQLKREFFVLNAINSGVKDVRKVIETAKKNKYFDSPNPILFIDEIHRFSKSQQDSLLHAVEQGVITLIGATTENPSFEVISALLSRCQIFTLNYLSTENLDKIILHALKNDYILKNLDIEIKEKDTLYKFSGGDARKLLNILDIVINNHKNMGKIIITNELVKNCIHLNTALYDKSGEMHYDIISAFIKSIRGSDPNAAIYWLARMIEGGEDPKFIARRLIISASEDIGLANPNALLLANNCFSAINTVGFPEARIILAQTTIYLASSAKSNSAYLSINKAQNFVKQTGNLEVPLHLRNAPTKLMKDLKYGHDYKYPHDFNCNFTQQEYLPEKISKSSFYKTQNNSYEQKNKAHLNSLWENKYDF